MPLPPPTSGFALLGLFQLLLVGLVLAVALLVFLTVRRLRVPPRRTYAWAVSRGVPGDPSELPDPRSFEALQLSIDDRGGRAAAWSIAGDRPGGPVILYTPGWGDAKIKVLQRLHAMAPVASTIIAWDPPGHGDSPGRCALGVREPRMIQHILTNALPAGTPAILWGHSLGGGVSIAAAAALEHATHTDDQVPQVLAVVAEAPYRSPQTPASRVMRQAGLPWSGIGPLAYAILGLRTGAGPRWSGFDRAGHAARLTHTPLLVIHGDLDAICPHEDGRAIAEAAPLGTLLTIPGGRHNDLWETALGTAAGVATWLDRALRRPNRARPASLSVEFLRTP